jgi:hypothetical protein
MLHLAFVGNTPNFNIFWDCPVGKPPKPVIIGYTNAVILLKSVEKTIVKNIR